MMAAYKSGNAVATKPAQPMRPGDPGSLDSVF